MGRSRRPCMIDEAIGNRAMMVGDFIGIERGPSSGLVWNHAETRPCWAICMGLNCSWRPSTPIRRMSARIQGLRRGRARTFYQDLILRSIA
jgi:hypothetical protein